MKSVNEMIEIGLKENINELINNIKELNSYNQIMNENKDFQFNVREVFDLSSRMLSVEFVFKNNSKQITAQLTTSEFSFNWNCIDISMSLIKYAVSYFNDKDITFNAGNDDGDYYTNIKEYITLSYLDIEEDSIDDLAIYDDTNCKVLY